MKLAALLFGFMAIACTPKVSESAEANTAPSASDPFEKITLMEATEFLAATEGRDYVAARSLDTILASPDANSILVNLCELGGPVGHYYALLGLMLIESPDLEKCLNAFKKDNRTLTISETVIIVGGGDAGGNLGRIEGREVHAANVEHYSRQEVELVVPGGSVLSSIAALDYIR